jgi:hypothetical protein
VTASTRALMEPRFAAGFSGVRLHTGSEAAQLNRTLIAQVQACFDVRRMLDDFSALLDVAIGRSLGRESQ